MAILKKTITLCNKCGEESENGQPNVTILGEDFFFCDACLERLLNWVNIKPTVEVQPQERPVTTSVKRQYASGYSRANSHNQVWDEVAIKKLHELFQQGLSYDKIGEQFAVPRTTIRAVIGRIQQAPVGTFLYHYRDWFPLRKHRRPNGLPDVKPE